MEYIRLYSTLCAQFDTVQSRYSLMSSKSVQENVSSSAVVHY